MRQSKSGKKFLFLRPCSHLHGMRFDTDDPTCLHSATTKDGPSETSVSNIVPTHVIVTDVRVQPARLGCGVDFSPV
jgi:hypothetical protein